jgi:hypothetical protein
MATRLVCDVCEKPTNNCVSRNGDFSLTNSGVYLSGSFTVQLDGKGRYADVCFDCVRKLLMASDVKVSDGAKAAPDRG